MNDIMDECLVAWKLNDIPQPPVLCSGQDIDALLLGRAVTTGLVDPGTPLEARVDRKKKWRVSADGAVHPDPGVIERPDSLPRNLSDCKADLSVLSDLCDRLMDRKHPAGMHAVLLYDGRKQVFGCDIGRHNALDQAVGKALMERMDLSHSVLCTTARLTLETLIRAARAGIPVLATQKTVGRLCIEWADRLDIAVCRIGEESTCYSSALRLL